MKVLEAVFLTSAARAADVPRMAAPQIALAGRSNVGKSSLVNALTRSAVARTSGAPGKTRLANVYRVTLAGGPAQPGRSGNTRWALHLVDLPGYGYTRGGEEARAGFARLTADYFDVGRLKAAPTHDGDRGGRLQPGRPEPCGDRGGRLQPGRPEPCGDRGGRLQPAHPAAVLLVVDARHPGLASDLEAWSWIQSLGVASMVVATKIDKLGRAERTRALGEIERALNSPATAVSAATGEGMDDLWTRIATLVRPPRATAQRR